MTFEPAEAVGEEELKEIAEAEGTGGPEWKDNPVIKGLLSTKPDLDPTETKAQFDNDLSKTHGWIGFRKFLNGVGIGGKGAGMPAIGNFGLAVLFKVQGQQEPVETDQQPANAGPVPPDEDTYEGPSGPNILSTEEAMHG